MKTTSGNEYVQKAGEVVDIVYSDYIPRFGWDLEDGLVHVEGSQDHARQMWKWIQKEKLEHEGVELIQGMISGFYPHSWFRVRVPTVKAGMPGVSWIIDPACPHCYPNALVLYPDSPLRKLYIMHEVVDGSPLWEGE